MLEYQGPPWEMSFYRSWKNATCGRSGYSLNLHTEEVVPATMGELQVAEIGLWRNSVTPIPVGSPW